MRYIFIVMLASIATRGASQQPKEVFTRYMEEVLNQRKIEVVDELFAEKYQLHILTHDEHVTNTIQKLKEFLTGLLKAVPDLKYTIGDIIQEGDRAAMRVRLTGTHKGELFGYPASGNQISMSEVFFCQVKEGKIVDFSVQIDWYHLFKQLQK